jgi:cytochrome P450
MVAAVPAIRRDPLAYLERLVRRYGDLVAFPMPRGAVLLVNDPDGVRRVLQDNPRNYVKRTVQYGSLGAVTGQGLLTSDGEPWRVHRRVLQPAFHHGAMPAFAAQAAAVGELLRGEWDAAAGGVLDADAAVMRAMLALVGRTLFAADLAAQAERIVGAVDVALALLVRRTRSGVPPSWPVPSRFRLRRAVRVLDTTCAELVAARRRRVTGSDDVLDLLLAAADAGEIGPGEVRDEIVTLVIAGYETVASSLAWTLGLLAAHPAEQAELAAELDAVLAGAPPTWADLPRLRFTRAVVDESLRLYPPAWVISRRAVADDVIAGVAVPPGTVVILSPWLLHRRTDDWPDPLRFDPTRFLVETRTSTPRGAYLPFGLGPRLCIGRDVALVEAVVVLATLLRDRQVTLPPSSPVPPPNGPARPGALARPDAALGRPDALVTLRPRGGLPLRLSPLSPLSPR